MLRTIFTALLVANFTVLFGQSDELLITGRFKIDGGTNKGATITLEKDGRKVKTIAGESKFEVGLDFQAIYIVSFEKEGFVTKRIRFDTHVPPERIQYGFLPFDFTVEIFEQFDDVNVVMFNQPVGKIAFSDLIDEFDYDTDYTQSIQARLDEVQDEVEKKKEEKAEAEEAAAEAEEQLNADVNKLVKQAEKSLSSGSPEEAIQNLEEASSLKDSPEIQQKIAEAKKALAAQEAEEKKQEQGAQLIDEAEEALANGDLEGAKKKFEQAAGLIEGDKRISQGLGQINDKLQEQAQKEEEYNQAISAAQEALNSGNYEAAVANSEKALAIKSSPEAEKVLKDAKAAAEEEAAAQAAAEEAEEKLNSLLAQADELGDSKDFEQALAKLEEAKALSNDPSIGEKIATLKQAQQEQLAAEQKAAENEQRLKELLDQANAALASGDLETAGSKAKEAEALDKDAAIEILDQVASLQKEKEEAAAAKAEAEEEYQKLVADAKAFTEAGDFDKATAALEEALTLKSDGQEAVAQRDLIAEKQSALAEAKAAEEAEQQEKQEAFEKLLSEAEAALARGDLATAKSAFTKAGELFEDKRVSKGLEDVADKELELAEAESAAAELDAEYQKLSDDGDAAVAEGRLDDALAAFTDAQKVKDTPEIQGKLSEVKEKQEALAAAAEEDAERLAAEEAKRQEEEAARLAEEEAKAAVAAEEAKAAAEAEEEKAAADAEEAKRLAEEQKAKEKEGQLEQEFNDLLAAGEEQMLQGEYAGALNQFEQAKKVNDNEIISAKIEEAKAKIKEQEALEENEAAAAEAKKAEEERLENQTNLIEKADKKIAKEDFEEAKLLLGEAAELGDNPQIDERLAQIDELIASAESEANSEEQAKREADELAAKQDAYDGLIKSADKEMKAENLESAKMKYAEAAELMPGNAYPTDKISEIEKLIAAKSAEEAAEAQQNSSEEAEKLANKEAEEAAAAAEKKRLEEEAEAKALEEQRLAEEQALEEERLAAAEAQRKKEEETIAANKEETVEPIQTVEEEVDTEEQQRQEEIDGLIARGDGLLKAGKLPQAKSVYTDAYRLDPSESIKNKVAQVDKLIAKRADDRRKAKAAAEAMSQGNSESKEIASILESESRKLDNSKPNPTLNLDAETKETPKPKLQIPEVEEKPKPKPTLAQPVMESDERPTRAVKGGAVVLSENRVGKAALSSPSANLSEEEKYDGVMNRIEEDNKQMAIEEEQRRLKEKYPERKTVETQKEGNSTVTYIYINRGEFVNVYKKVEHSWGGVFYFVDEQATNQRFWEHETQ